MYGGMSSELESGGGAAGELAKECRFGDGGATGRREMVGGFFVSYAAPVVQVPEAVPE